MTPKKRADEDEVVEPLAEDDATPAERLGGPGPEPRAKQSVSGAGTYSLDPAMWAITEVDLGGGVVLRHGQSAELTAEQVDAINGGNITAFGERVDVLISA